MSGSAGSVGRADPVTTGPPTGLRPLPRVVYLMGAGRSGSTVLGILLGNLPGVFYGGELMAWNHFGGVPISEREDVQAFWSAVADRVPRRAEHHRTDFFPLLEHHRALLHPDRLVDPVLRTRYEVQNRELLAATRAVSGSEVVVDSSHFPLRAWRLTRQSGLDVVLVHLVRDPRDVVAALRTPVQRRRPMGVLQANAYCLLVALLSSIVLLATPKHRRRVVRYEDLLADPAGTLADLARLVDADPSGVRTDALEVGPVFQGNRLRHRRHLAIEPPAPRPPTGSRSSRAVTAVVQLPVLLRYGYLGGRRPRGRSGGS